ncbi:N-acetyltransferase ats1 [Lasiodiplodia hormozganensis]|uniref:N-acetyltransferase ats1 n=1 Tax=Lasiodiplodia hormozganensis TaxID=869390 RepID=A0AA39U3D3_9PEZI|nr:N-acetyltransferase ats1 [Lasiodiplodia hormozganensis]
MPALPTTDASGARHLLRALLRECTYLPDPAARIYVHRHVLRRFREYHPPQGKHRDHKDHLENPAFSPQRIRGALKNAWKGLNFLRRVNEGEVAPLQQLLLLTYGRTGRRRHELMDTLLIPDAVGESEAVRLWQADVAATLDPSEAITGIPKAVAEAPRRNGKPHKYEISQRYSRLRALLESQRRYARPVELRRAKLKLTYLEVPLTNIWMRPFPRKRERNMVRKWYASILDKVFPPLPEDEWERLRDLVSGVRKWHGFKRRRPAACTTTTTTMSDKPSIRLATREDVGAILDLIKELAIYENALDSVQATEESLAATLSFAASSSDGSSSTSSGYAKTLLVTAPEGEVAGMALFFNNYSTWRAKPGVYLEDLFVKSKYRRRGYGKLLIQELAKEVQRIDGARLEWSCLKWNEPSLKFYAGIGAKQMEEWVGLRVDGEALTHLAEGKAASAGNE